MGIPLIALAGRSPEITDPQTIQMNAQRIQALRGQNALQPGQLEGQQNDLQMQKIQLEQAKRQQQDSQTVQDLLQQNNGDFEKTLPQLAGKVSFPTYQALQKAHLEHVKTLAEIDEKQLSTEKDHADRLSAIGDAASKMSDEDYMSNWASIAEQADRIRPNLGLDPNNPMPRQQFAASLLGLKTTAQYLDQEKARREAQKAQEESASAAAKLPGEQAGSALKQEELKAVQSGGVAPGVPLENQEANSWLKAHPGKSLADYQKYKATLVPAFNFNLQAQGAPGSATLPAGTSPEDAYKTFGAKGPTVKAIVEGRQTPPTSFAQKSPYWQDVMSKVYQVDPEFTEQRAQLRKAFTVGPQSKEVNAINTAMGHVGVLGEAIDALNNGDVRVLNSIANKLGVETGNDKITTFKTIVHRVGPEISKAYIGAGGSAGERGADEKDFDANLSPQQLKSNVAVTAQLLRSKISSFENQWEQNKAPGMPSFKDRFIMPEAKKQLDKLNPQGGAGVIFARDPQGKLHQAKTGTALPEGWKLEQQK